MGKMEGERNFVPVYVWSLVVYGFRMWEREEYGSEHRKKMLERERRWNPRRADRQLTKVWSTMVRWHMFIFLKREREFESLLLWIKKKFSIKNIIAHTGFVNHLCFEQAWLSVGESAWDTWKRGDVRCLRTHSLTK